LVENACAMPMPETEPIAPPITPHQPEAVPEPPAVPTEPAIEPDPFNPDWPETRPLPPPKA